VPRVTAAIDPVFRIATFFFSATVFVHSILKLSREFLGM
jgi:hypothetical protein